MNLLYFFYNSRLIYTYYIWILFAENSILDIEKLRKRIKDEWYHVPHHLTYVYHEFYACRNLYLRSPHKGRQIAEHISHLVFFAGAAERAIAATM